MAKKRKKSLVEIEYGEGAVKFPAKFIMEQGWDIEIEGERFKKLMIIGIGITKEDIVDLGKKKKRKCRIDDTSEMWEGEFIFIPKRKHQIYKNDEDWVGLRADQRLRNNWGSPEDWEEKIFDIEEL